MSEMGNTGRSVASFGVICLFSLSLAATAKPTESGEGGAAKVNAYDFAFTSVVTAANAPLPAARCTDTMLTTSLASIVLHTESWAKPDPHQIELVDQPVAAQFTRANAKMNYADDGLWVINSPLVRDLHPKNWDVSEQSDSKISTNLAMFAPHPLFAVLRADVRKMPKVNAKSDDYVGGMLIGKLVVSRMDTGAPICLIPFAAESSPSVKFKTHGITGKSFDKAIHDDFIEQVGVALKAAVTSVAPSYQLDVGT